MWPMCGGSFHLKTKIKQVFYQRLFLYVCSVCIRRVFMSMHEQMFGYL